MRQAILTLMLSCSMFRFSAAQNFRKIASTPDRVDFSEIYYNSDSVFYCSVYTNGTTEFCVFKNNQWQFLDFKNGKLFTEPGSKIYFINTNSFCIVNPVTNKIEKTYPYDFFNVPKQFKVINDTSFIAYVNSDAAIYQYDFNQKEIFRKSILLSMNKDDYLSEFKIKVVNDSLLYFYVKGNLYLKNLLSGTISKLFSNGYISDFDCFKNHIVIASSSIYLSNDFGKTFISNGSRIGRISLKLHPNSFSFVNANTQLVTMDFNFKTLKTTDVTSQLVDFTKFYTAGKCKMFDIIGGFVTHPVWLNDSFWMITVDQTDIYKVSLNTDAKVKFLGGRLNIGTKYNYTSPSGKTLFRIGTNNHWAISSDTGKTWKHIEKSMFQTTNRAECQDSSIFYLENDKLIKFDLFQNQKDTTFFKSDLQIKDFGRVNKDTFILYSNSGIFSLDKESRTIQKIGTSSPFKAHAYLKKQKRIIAFTDVDIYMSDNFGKSWAKSEVRQWGDFHTFEFGHSIKVYEITGNYIFLNALLNDSAVLLISKDTGRSFTVNRDNNRAAAVELYGSIYSIYKNGLVLISDTLQNQIVYDTLKYTCPPIGMVALDSGLLAWNIWSEIYYSKVPYSKINFTAPPKDKPKEFKDRITVFPNPVNAQSVLKVVLDSNKISDISHIALCNTLGQTLEHVVYTFSAKENCYTIRNLPQDSPKLYYLKIKLKDGSFFCKKVFVY